MENKPKQSVRVKEKEQRTPLRPLEAASEKKVEVKMSPLMEARQRRREAKLKAGRSL